MTNFKIREQNNGYKIVQPTNGIGYNEMGFVMVVNSKGEVLKFFTVDKITNARAYFKYISLTRWEKLKYWIHYKRGQ